MKDVQGMPVKANGEDGDAMLWAGLMVAVGDIGPIKGVKQCQSKSGRLWRSPLRVNMQAINPFSRDMALGFILYYQHTKDNEMADKWLQYIQKTGALFPPSESSDTRHIISPSLWWLMSYAGFNVPWYWEFTRFIFPLFNRLETYFTPRGYQRHLKGVSLLILAKATGKLDIKTANILYKADPQNAFFAWLAGDKENAIKLNNQLESQFLAHNGEGHQWCWERADDEKAWLDSMGWEFDFIRRLLSLKI
jgi:hypothetical protein